MRTWPVRGVLAFGVLAVLPACTETPLVSLTLGYAGFEPACIQVHAADSSGASPSDPVEVRVPPENDKRSGTLHLAIFGQSGWGDEILVVAEAHERSCAGNIVAQARDVFQVKAGQPADHRLDLAASDVDEDGFVATANNGTDCDDAIAEVHPGAQEICNSRDDNCVNGIDEGYLVNVTCGDAGCGTIQCATDGGSFCAPGAAFYPDGDSDGYGRTADVQFFCTAQAGYSPDAGDCDDANPRAHPGLAEACDGVDNNCVNGIDEGFMLGAGCTTRFGCPGQNVCVADGGARCQPTGGGTGLHPDEDEDGHGAPAEICNADAGGTPVVTSADDCDDGDPYSAPGKPEICDRRDNDCDGQVDRDDAGVAACPAGAAWIAHQAGGNGHHWRSISSWTDGGVWVVGLGGKFRPHAPDDVYAAGTQWTNDDNDCGGLDWTGVWADPATGNGYGVGPVGQFGVHDLPSNTCAVQSAAVSTNLSDPVSVVGFRNGPSLELYVVGRDGGTLRWLPDGGSQTLAATPARLNDIHGTSADNLFAAGVMTAPMPPDGRLFKYLPPAMSWQVTPLPTGVRNTGASVEAVYAVSPRLAFAVTDGGSVLEWDGGAWGLHSSPPGAGALRGVLAFGKSSLFVIDAQTAWEWNGTTWSKLVDAGVSPAVLVDIHGTNPADIWVAQDPTMVYRWPQ